MPIIDINPSNWGEPQASIDVVQIDAEAASNRDAVGDIEDWAAEHGFARVNEYFLRRIRRKDGRIVFRGVCYRLTEEERRSSEAECQSHMQTLASLPVTAHG